EHRWHDADVNLFPLDPKLFEGDLKELIRDFVIAEWAPPEPVLTADDRIVALGSCFARELRTFLGEAGLPASLLAVPAGLNNTFRLLDFVSWCVTGEETQRAFRYDRLETGEISEWKPEQERIEFEQLFAETGVFVISFGISEVWEDRETGGIFWRGVPDAIFDADRHVFRLTTVEENSANIRRIIDLIRQSNPDATIVLTLSPVPAKATFRDIPLLSADSVSKSVLRVALDQVVSEKRPGVYYWPGF